MAEISFVLQIQNKKGLHARAASAFVREADKFQSDIFVEKDGQKVSGRSIMGLMMLAAGQGSSIAVFASGDDAEDAQKALSCLVNNRFGEEE